MDSHVIVPAGDWILVLWSIVGMLFAALVYTIARDLIGHRKGYFG